MKKFVIMISVCFALCCALLCACNKTDYKLELNYYEYELFVNYSFDLDYSGCPQVMFSSSNEAVASVDQAGVVIGKSSGECIITVKHEDQVKTCKVTVIEKEQSTLIVTLNVDENISLLKGSSPIRITPNLKVDGVDTQAQFTFVSQDESVATINTEGEIIPANYGVTAVIISVNYQEKTITKTVIVNVIADVDIRFEDYAFTLYTTSVSKNQHTSFVPNLLGVYVDGVKIENANVTYEYDQNLLKFENGKVEVIANKGAETEFTAVFYDENNIKYTCPIQVEILFPVIDKSEDTKYYVGNWKDSLRGDKNIGREQITFNEKVFEEEIVGVYDVTTGEEVNLNYNPQTFELENTELVKGSKVWKIYSEDYAVMVSVTVVDMAISTADEFVKTLSIATDEHIVLVKDIENVGHYQNSGNVFSGVLDGNYHTVSGVDFSKSAAFGGLFYRIDNATIKNIAFKNVDLSVYRQTINEQTTAYPHGLIGYQGYRSTISNIYANVYSTASEYEGGLFHWIGAGIILKDTVIVYENKYLGSEVGVLSRTCDAVVTIENVYTVRSSTISLIKTLAQSLTAENLAKLNENLQKINVEFNNAQQFYLYRNTLSLTDFHLAVLESDGVGDNYEEDDFTD